MDGLPKTLIFVILSLSSSLLFSNRCRNDGFLFGLPCVILTIGLSLIGSLVSVLLTLGLRYLLLKLPLVILVLNTVVVETVVVPPLSLYLGARTEFAETSCALNLIDGVYLLDPLLCDLPRSLLLGMDVSVRGASA